MESGLGWSLRRALHLNPTANAVVSRVRVAGGSGVEGLESNFDAQLTHAGSESQIEVAALNRTRRWPRL